MIPASISFILSIHVVALRDFTDWRSRESREILDTLELVHHNVVEKTFADDVAAKTSDFIQTRGLKSETALVNVLIEDRKPLTKKSFQGITIDTVHVTLPSSMNADSLASTDHPGDAFVQYMTQVIK